MEFNYLIQKEKDRFIYIRGEKRVEVSFDLKIREYPILSIDESVTNFFGIVLDHPVYVNEEGHIKIYVKIPLDIGIFATNGMSYKLIDRIDVFPKKFALYGSIGEGVIYRYWKTSPYLEQFTVNKNEAITAIEIVNKADSIGGISKVIFNSKYFSLYSFDESICGEIIRVTRLVKGLAIVKPINKPTIDNAKRIPTSPAITAGGEFEMRFGT